MKMRIMIAEDEYLAKDELIYMLEKEKDVELCPSAESKKFQLKYESMDCGSSVSTIYRLLF